MRLDFNVLWVDDQPERIEAQARAIARGMEQEGFNFVRTMCTGTDQLQPLLAGNVFSDEIDLILVDWDLGNNVHGEDVIAQVRERVRYKDVVFYSANTAPDELRRLAANSGLEGIYCASREGLTDEVIGVFESLVKKVLDLDHTRGIVMAATSDIDHMVNQCLIAVHGKLDGNGRTEFVSAAIELVEKRIAQFSERLEALKTDGSVEALMAAHLLFTANDRLRILSRSLKREQFDGQAGARKAVTAYMEKVVPERNILGHQVLTPEGKPTAVVDASGQEIGLDKLRELRRLILALRADFRGLVQGFTS